MAEVIFLVGLPGSGKSTYAGYLAKSGYKVFSSDAFREATGITNSAVVFKNLCRSIKQAVRDGHDCVLDATNLVADKRIDMILKIEETGANITCDVFTTPADVCKERNRRRTNTHGVTDEVIDKMLSSYEPPKRCEGFSEIRVHGYDKGSSLKAWPLQGGKNNGKY